MDQKNNTDFELLFREIEEIRHRLDLLEKRTKDDADATVKDIVELRERVDYLENQIKKLELAQNN